MAPRAWTRLGLARTATFVVLWLATAATMVLMHLRAGSTAHDGGGALAMGLAASVVELAILLAILRPWSYERSWLRALLGCIVFTPIAVISVFAALHTGAIATLHAFWLLGLTALLGVATAWSLGTAYAAVTVHRGALR